MKENTLDTPMLLFNLHEVLVRDDEVVLCVESFLFLGIKIVSLTIVQPFTEREDLFILRGKQWLWYAMQRICKTELDRS